jgi:hypothetical protein
MGVCMEESTAEGCVRARNEGRLTMCVDGHVRMWPGGCMHACRKACAYVGGPVIGEHDAAFEFLVGHVKHRGVSFTDA